MAKVSLEQPAKRWSDLSPSQKKLLLAIRSLGACTREQIGAKLDWPASSVSREVSPLLVEKILFSDPPGQRRRNATLSASGTLCYAIGVEVGVDFVRATVIDFNGKPTGPVRDYTPDNRTPPAFLRCIEKAIRELLVQHHGLQLMGIGVGFADRSAWNPAEAFSEQPRDRSALLHVAIAKTFDLPLFCRSDAACAALGEWRNGRLRGTENGLFLHYSEGIGLGIISSGRVVFGDWNDAGEIGHIPLDDDGEYCYCGNIGCLETVAAQWALTKKAKQIMEGGGQVGFRRVPNNRPPHVDELCTMAAAGDPLARNMLTKAGRAIGRALAISASLFDPSKIILGGYMSSETTYEPLIRATRESFQSLTAHRTPQPIVFESSALGRDATVIGAAELVFSDTLV